MIHLFFEQSGTFKREFNKLGYKALDYDILNDFNETDQVIDLYQEIKRAFENGVENTIFSNINSNDLIMAFFPCIRFENQILLHFRGDAVQQKNWSLEKKLLNDIDLHKELNDNYLIITQLVIICLRKNIPLIIENPFSEQHYLIKYWALKPSIIEVDRHKFGDYYKKPTMFYFVNIKPKTNLLFDEPLGYYERKTLSNTSDRVKRSCISPEYARYFIRSYVL